MDLLTDAIGLLGPEEAASALDRVESPSDFISKEDSIPFGPVFPLPQFGQGLDGVHDFSLPADFVTRFLWYQKRSELHYERQGKPQSSRTLTTKDERKAAKAERDSSSPGSLSLVGRGRSGGTSSKPPPYKHLRRNTFYKRNHVVLHPDEVQVCECKPADHCALDHCLNAVTHVECTPGYCPCGETCQNQRFQRCQYANVKPCKTEGRGWGLYAQEDIKAGQFVVEYCGEIISDKEAIKRSEDYRMEGLRDHYMLILSGTEVIDATKKGSYGRFINHSCDPSCVTKKWNVLGEVRVGVFANRDIPAGEELTYDYDFEWYGGDKVRCQCGSEKCIGFLGAKSKRFKEDLVLWEDDDERYEVDNVPTYDSDDEPIGGRQQDYYSSDGEGSSRDSGRAIGDLANGGSQMQSGGRKRVAAAEPGRDGPVDQFASKRIKQEAVDSEVGPSVGVDMSASIKVERLSTNPVSVSQSTVTGERTVKVSGSGFAKPGRFRVPDGQPHDRIQVKSTVRRKRVKKEGGGLGARLRLVKEHKKVVRGSSIMAGRLVVKKASAKAQLEGTHGGRKRKGLLVKKLVKKSLEPIEWVPSEAARSEIQAKEDALARARAELEKLREELKAKAEKCVETGEPMRSEDAQRWLSRECTLAQVAFDRHFAFLVHGLGLASHALPSTA